MFYVYLMTPSSGHVVVNQFDEEQDAQDCAHGDGSEYGRFVVDAATLCDDTADNRALMAAISAFDKARLASSRKHIRCADAELPF